MNKLFKNISIGFESIKSNFTRVFLTSIGLTIGIFTVSIVTAVTILTVKIPMVKPIDVRKTLVKFDFIDSKPIEMFLNNLFI